MGEHLDRAKKYHAAIHDVLWREWDPIGVSHLSGAEDEYDSYIGQIYGMLIRREPRRNWFDFLWWVETEHMGLKGNRQHTESIADRLLAIADLLK